MVTWFAQLQQELKTENLPAFYSFSFVPQIDSTNRVVKQWGKEGAFEGRVLIACSQTAGRGRLGRSFFSPDSGIYLSVLLRPDLSPKETLRLTTAAAVAVAQALGESAQIKWVNDVFLKGKKVCGVLTESALTGKNLDYAVVGIGLNLWQPTQGFPQDLQQIAGPIFDTKPTEKQVAELVGKILTRFYECYQNIFDPAILEVYQKRNLLQGKTVTAGKVCGRVVGIAPDFSLQLQEKNGKIHTVQAGEATIGSATFKENELC